MLTWNQVCNKIKRFRH